MLVRLSKRASIRKLKRYGELIERLTTFGESSSYSKSKGKKKGKEKADAKERIVTEMEMNWGVGDGWNNDQCGDWEGHHSPDWNIKEMWST